MKLSAPVYLLKRQAKALSRQQKIPLHKALDVLARGEGFRSWSLLAAQHAKQTPGAKLLQAVSPGDMLLIGARPGQGKTTLSMEMAVSAMKNGAQGVLFTLEYSEREVLALFDALGENPHDYAAQFVFDNADEICADYIIARLASVPAGSVVVVDYLQLLDQDRNNPPLMEQVQSLKRYAIERDLIMVFVSQIHRRFDADARALPTLADVRLPNPLDLLLFNKACFMHEGRLEMTSVV